MKTFYVYMMTNRSRVVLYIKGWRREKKNELVRAMNPKWKDLGQELFDPGSGKVTRRERCE
jgi:hypothetical protein